MPTQLQPLPVIAPQGLIDIDAFRAEIVRELHDQILAGIHVRVDSPQIAAPQVQVSPDITVQPADVTMDMSAMTDMCACLVRIEGLLVQLMQVLSTPETTRVSRSNGEITEMVKRRG